MAELDQTSREWSDRIRQLLQELKLTQAGLADRLGVSPATVSRWLAGKNEPTAETYVALGNLAGRPDGAYFWERAGIDTSELPDASLRQTLSSIRATLADFNVGDWAEANLDSPSISAAKPMQSPSRLWTSPHSATVSLRTRTCVFLRQKLKTCSWRPSPGVLTPRT